MAMENKTTSQIAKHLRDLHFGKNWTWSYIKQHLDQITWQQAITKVYSLNTIAVLVYHINYYIKGQIDFLEKGTLDIQDKFSFDCPPIRSENDWQRLKEKTFTEAEKLAKLIEQINDSQLWEFFKEEKYGNYYRNFHGLIEHSHYHLGQIVIIKNILLARQNKINE